MCEQVRSASLLRFRRQRGAVSDRTLALVQATVARFIDH
jgi:mRNA-degrading endonuclease toxin of MazEF toxin-antitoxin module